jgi:hypothetical protein
MRSAYRLLLVLAAAFAALPLPVARAGEAPPLLFTYHDSGGQGVLAIQDAGPDEATGGQQIKVTLTKGGVRHTGSGVTLQLEQGPPYTTLITFSLTRWRGLNYFFQGKMISGITLSGSGTYHITGYPEKSAKWSIVLGAPGAASGIRGVAMAGPIYPHEIPGVINEKPLADALIVVEGETGKEVARQRTDANGRFQIPLAPGTYRVVPLPPGRPVFPRAEPFQVVVRPGEFKELIIDYNTGIR